MFNDLETWSCTSSNKLYFGGKMTFCSYIHHSLIHSFMSSVKHLPDSRQSAGYMYVCVLVYLNFAVTV